MTIQMSVAQMQDRLVRYDELRPCTTAFIDTRTPGSERKENFTIIGPGVAENVDQHVHIRLPHGFNIGAARQPPGCVNSQHSHETAEVFVIHTGKWRFKTGVDGTDGFVDLQPGDTISIPTHTFRGFENIGTDVGFMFSVLGGDVPGRVTWAPYVFDAANQHGLVLLESGRLIDTTRESLPVGAILMHPTTQTDVAALTRLDSASIRACTVASSQLASAGGLTRFPGFEECPIIGLPNPEDGMPAAPLAWRHGFQLRALRIAPGSQSLPHVRREEEVLLVHAGRPDVRWGGGAFNLGPGDTLTLPAGLSRILENHGSEPAVIYVVRGGDYPGALAVLSTV